MQMAAIWPTRWGDATAGDVTAAIRSGKPGEAVAPDGKLVPAASVNLHNGVTYYVPYAPEGSNPYPRTFAFQTRKGDLGLLQVMRYTTEPYGMRIRYKLVQPSMQKEAVTLVDSASDSWAKAMFDSTSHDFGEVQRGSTAETRFVIENIYAEEVHVLSVASDFADCFPARLTAKTLKTWDKAEILVTMDTSRFVGRRSGTIRVDFDRPFRGHVELHVTGYIGERVSAAPLVPDKKSIVGTWKVVDSSSWDKMFKSVSVAEDGKTENGVPVTKDEPKAAAQRTPTVITKDTLFGFYQYKLDAAKTPKAIDVLLNGKVVMLGIYELRGDRLQFHFSKTPQRPTTFDHKPENDADDLYVLLERVTTP